MIRREIAAFLDLLDDELDAGLHESDEGFLDRAREALRSEVIAEGHDAKRWLQLELGDIERRYGVALRAPQEIAIGD